MPLYLKLRLSNALTPTASFTTTPSFVGKFVKGVNFGGESVIINDYPWESYSDALKNGLSVSGETSIKTDFTPEPSTSAAVSQMLNTAIYKAHTLEITQTVENGSYAVYLWIMENSLSGWHKMSVSLNGQRAAQYVGKLRFRHWGCYGPYKTIATQGKLEIAISTHKPHVDAHIMGMSLFQCS